MPAKLTNTTVRDLRTLFQIGPIGSCTDAQLLEQFRSEGPSAEAAFTALVTRHGPMVLRVCRGVLNDEHDAQDAFQATFLVLVRKAASVRNRSSVASWLYGVAHRVSSRAKVNAA
ncbi:RNA polymerase sigma factor, partial [Singulisphaera rosea]